MRLDFYRPTEYFDELIIDVRFEDALEGISTQVVEQIELVYSHEHLKLEPLLQERCFILKYGTDSKLVFIARADMFLLDWGSSRKRLRLKSIFNL